jgi:hypothetical protein
MFRATHRSSSGAQNCNYSLWFYIRLWLPAATNVCKTRGCNYSFELLMVSLETCWAIKKRWNNKFYYTAASCWLFLYDLYYDARIHEHQVPILVWFRILERIQLCYFRKGRWKYAKRSKAATPNGEHCYFCLPTGSCTAIILPLSVRDVR